MPFLYSRLRKSKEDFKHSYERNYSEKYKEHYHNNKRSHKRDRIYLKDICQHSSSSEGSHRRPSPGYKYYSKERSKRSSSNTNNVLKEDKPEKRYKEMMLLPTEIVVSEGINIIESGSDTILNNLPKSYKISNMASQINSKNDYKFKRSKLSDNTNNECYFVKERTKDIVMTPLKWEQELYETNKKNKLFNESEQKVRILSIQEPNSLNASIYVPDRISVSNNELTKNAGLITTAMKKCDDIKSMHTLKTDLGSDACFDEINDLENMPLVCSRAIGHGRDCLPVPYIVFDYHHEDKNINNDIIDQIINEKIINKNSSCINYDLECMSYLQTNYPSKSTENEGLSDLRVLADLIVNASYKECITPPVPNVGSDMINKLSWSLVKLDLPKLRRISSEEIDITKCHKDDPRVAHLRLRKD